MLGSYLGSFLFVLHVTELRNPVVVTPVSYFRGLGLEYRPALVAKCFRGFTPHRSQFIANCRPTIGHHLTYATEKSSLNSLRINYSVSS
jgi:hypothetical protein